MTKKSRLPRIDRDGAVPLYRQIADALRGRIDAGELRSDDKLPPEELLAADLAVSRKTIRQALTCLEQQGYLARRRGHGTFVRQPQRVQRVAIVTDTAGATGAATFQAIMSGVMLELGTASLQPSLHLAEQVLQADGEWVDAAELAAVIAVRCQATTIAALVAACGPRGVPVIVEGRAATGATASVVLDSASGMQAAAAHLLALGHRRFGILSYPAAILPDAPHRERAAREAITAGGGVVPAGWLLRCPGTQPAEVSAAARALLARPQRPTAFITVSDTLAAGLVQMAAQLGVRVPGDLSITGFDDLPLCAFLHPPLTTVRQDYPALGRLAAQQAVTALAGTRLGSQPLRLTPTLTVRASTAAPQGKS